MFQYVILNQLNYHWQIPDGEIQYGSVKDGLTLLSCVQAPLCIRGYIRPAIIYEGERGNYILDSAPGSHVDTIAVVVGGFHAFVNLLMSD